MRKGDKIKAEINGEQKEGTIQSFDDKSVQIEVDRESVNADRENVTE